MYNILPKRILIRLEDLPDDVKLLEDIFNVNLYNSQLLEEIVNVLKYEDRAKENIENYCGYLSNISDISDDYKNMVFVIKTLAFLLFDILKSHKLYVNNSLKYEVLGIDKNKLFLKHEDINIPEEILELKWKEYQKYVSNDRFNVGLFRFITEYGNK